MMQDRVIDVFISYSSKDKAIADAVCNRLESGNLRCWYAPRDILPGADWATSVVHAIQRSRVFLLVYSENTNHSKHVFNELTMAFNSNCAIIPFRMDDSVMNSNIAFYLSSVHWLDATSTPMEPHLDYLFHYVRSALKGTTPPPPPGTNEEGAHNRKGKQVIKSVVIVLVCLLTVAAGMFGTMYLLDHFSGGTETRPGKITVQTIKMQEISETGSYRYPALGFQMLSPEADLYFAVEEESNKLNLVDLSTGKILISEIEHDFTDLYMVSAIITAEYHTIYFVDETEKRILIYDRRNAEWINREGFPLSLSEQEFYAFFAYQSHSFYSDNENMETVWLFTYDFEAGCYAQIIEVTPEGIRKTTDIRNLKLTSPVDFFNFETRHSSCLMMLNQDLNLVVLDIENGELLDLSFKAIQDQYIPHLKSGGTVLSQDGRYLVYTDGYDTKVWDLEEDRRVFSKLFTSNYSAMFAGDHEFAYYSWADDSLHIYDLQEETDVIVLDKAYFEDNKSFLQLPYYRFYYDYEHALYFWISVEEESDGGYSAMITATDKEGNVHACSSEMHIPSADYDLYIEMDKGYLFACFIKNAAAEQDLPETILYRAMYSEDSDGNLVFADVYYYDG